MKIEFGNKFARIRVKDSNILPKDKTERIYAKNSESEKSIINQKDKKPKNLLLLKFSFSDGYICNLRRF